MSRILAVVCILFVSFNSAQAIECQTGMQGGDGHWAWRLIDGRQCWYKGAIGMDKSLLHWSVAKESPDRPGGTPDTSEIKKARAMSESQPIGPEILNMLPTMPPPPTFEDRWNLR